MSNTQSYTYTALSSCNYRLLRLNLDQKDQLLKGEICEYAVGQAPPYLCLSYAWSTNRDKRRAIEIQGKNLPITDTISTVLRWIRTYRSNESDESSVLVWIDSMCINQDDLEERAEQVQHMKRIYSEAELVLVYLGEEEDGSNDIPELYKKIHGVYDRWSGPSVQDSKRIELKNLSLRELDETGLPPSDDPIWAANRAFLQRPWFLRTWIIQEAVLARKLLFVCGNWGFEGEGLIIPWHIIIGEQLPHISLSAANSISAHSPGGRAVSQILLMLNLGMGIDEKTTPSLVDLLQRCRQALATNPRDYVYGVLGLASDNYRQKILVNYGESVVDTYQRVAETIISMGDGAELLYNIHGLESELDLPSWVPDWSTERVPFFSLAPATGSASTTLDIPYVCAGGKVPSNMRVLRDQKVLLCKGYIIDIIEHLTEFRFDEEEDSDEKKEEDHTAKNKPYENNSLETKEAEQDEQDEQRSALKRPHEYQVLVQCLAEMTALLHQKSAYPPEKHEDVIWRTSIWNRARSGQRKIDASSYPLYQSFHKFVEFRNAIHQRKLGEFGTRMRVLDKELGFIIPGSVAAKITIQGALDEEDRARRYADWANSICMQMRRCRTERGYLGQVCKSTKVGDVVCVIQGAAVPFTMRKDEAGRGWKLVGQCYLHGFMEGEALSDPHVTSQDIMLV